MATYSFDTINVAQAQAFTSGDTLTFPTGHSTDAAVTYGPILITISLNGRSVDFSQQLTQVAGTGHGLVFADGSLLFIGDSNRNFFIQQLDDTTAAAVFGGGGDDSISVGAGANLIQGNAGNDSISLGTGSNTVYGGQGDDGVTTAVGPAGTVPGNDFIQGNKGNDRIIGGWGADTLLGGQGDDTISGGSGADFINGNLGNDSLSAVGNGCQAFGEDGNDQIFLLPSSLTAGGSATAHGGAGDDRLIIGGFVQLGEVGLRGSIWGDDGNDYLSSLSPAADDMHGGDGDDTLTNANGLATGNDLLDGGDGNDLIVCGFGHDTVFGGAGDDTINEGEAGETIDSGSGNDSITSFNGGGGLISAGDGDDVIRLHGGSSNRVDAGAGNDSISDTVGFGGTYFGGAGDDTISTNNPATSLDGGDGNDLLSGGQSLSGGAGNDTLTSADMFDNRTGNTVDGGAGDDVIYGGISFYGDRLFGGTGADRFIFGGNGASQTSLARIMDWEARDTLQFAHVPAGLAGFVTSSAADFSAAASFAVSWMDGYEVVAVQVGTDVIVFAGVNGHIDSSVELVGRSLADITVGNIV